MRALLLACLCFNAASAWALPATGLRGMVASADAAASEAGAEILRAGGNAVDAAVATAFAVAVTEPYSSGIGGGGFALVRMGSELHFVDFREVAPQAARRDMFMKDGAPDPVASRDGALSAGVPGAVMGYLGLHQRWGKLPRARVLEPAIRLAERGFRADGLWVEMLAWRQELLERDPEAARIFLVKDATGRLGPPAVGSTVVQKDLAATLKALAKEGPATFYKGAIAKKLAADMQARGGILTADDLARYQVRDRQPLVGSFRGLAVASSPPPSAGGQVVLTLLNLLESLPETAAFREPTSLHLYVEASKRAFADRHLLGDPPFVADPTAALVAKARAGRLRARIGAKATAALDVPPGQDAELPAGMVVPKVIAAPPRASAHTTHLCTVDALGNAVSLTTTVNYPWGAGIVAKGTGVIWNDQMDDFAIAPGVPNVYGIVGSEANAIAPGKTPLSSMSPTMVFEGPTAQSPVRLVVGSPGGPRIPTTVVQAIWHHLVGGADVEKAIDLGRLHHQHLPDLVSVEPFALEPATWRELEKLGHKLEASPETWSNATIIAIDPKSGLRTGAADSRGTGAAVAE